MQNSLFYYASNSLQKVGDDRVLRVNQAKQCIIDARTKSSIHTPYDAFVQPFEKEKIESIVQCAFDIKQKMCPDAVVIIGIGGSHLCIQAVEQLLSHAKKESAHIPIWYVDTVDSDMLTKTKEHIVQFHRHSKKVLLIIISKSGATLETVVNASVLLQTLAHAQWKTSVVCITDTGSPLEQWARTHEIQYVSIEPCIGGRFSAFTAVGLLPLALIGIDIQALCAGAAAYDEEKDKAAERAFHLYEAVQNGKLIHDFFVFASDAYSLGLWYRQLMGETIGKRNNLQGKEVRTGLFPTVSIGTSDLHSVGQLYLAGPRASITTFLTMPSRAMVQLRSADKGILPQYLEQKTVGQVMDAIAHATLEVYAQEKLDYMHIHMPEKSAFYVGQCMYMAMREMVYLAALLEINPFDQPEVERYKQRARALLAN